MKKNCSTRSAFFNRRIFIGVLLVIVSGVLALLAFGVRFDSQKLASISKPKRGGAGVPLSKIPGEPLQGIQDQTPANYTGPRNDRRPVKPVYTRPLRDLPKIPPSLAIRREVREPQRPKAPTDKPTAGFVQTFLGSVVSAPTATDLNFLGVGVGLAGFVPSSNPPDTNGRVGAKQYVQWNNTSFAVFDKTTGELLFGPVAGNTLFQSLGGDCATHNDGDPVVSFDILAGRWVLSQFVVGGSPDFSHQCVAVSQTEDATGAYYLYDFVTDSVNFVDYPKTGVWPDGYYMSGHIFNPSGTAFLAGRIFVFERDKMLQGQLARQLQKDLKTYNGKPQFGFLPSDLDSLTPPPAGEAAFVIGPDPVSTKNLDSARVAVTWGNTPTINLTETRISAPWSVAPCVGDPSNHDFNCVPQPSPATAADYLDNLSFHLMYRLPYRNFGGNPVQESLVANVTVNGGNSKPDHGAIRWFEFRNAGSSTTAPTVFQASTYDPDSAYRWMGSIAMDKDHNIALGYSKSSLMVKPSIFITGRLSTDPLNTLGSEAQVTAGTGVQQGGGNRWGDYSAMTVDPVDQCTFYYTNEYLTTNGAFNWSTTIASFRFPSCTSAPAWGALRGTVRSSPPNPALLSGVIVTLSNGYAGATDSNGDYSFLVPPGTYTATAADADRNCTSASPSNPTVTITSGDTTTQNFTMVGTSNLQENSVTIDDTTSGGNGNGVINRNECVNLNIGLKNNGCANATGISATLTTTTAGVTVAQGSSNYPNMVIDATGTNSTPFKIQTANNFACGTEIEFDLNLTFTNGSKTIHITVPTCAGGANQTFSGILDANDPTQADRLGRDGQPSGCGGKGCIGGGFPGTKRFQTFEFDNNSASAACFTVTINAIAQGVGDIESVAYLGTYDPTNLCLNYLGDSGVVGLGGPPPTHVDSATYSFTVPAGAHFVVVVNTTGTITTSAPFTGIVSGFVNDNAGPGPCSQ